MTVKKQLEKILNNYYPPNDNDYIDMLMDAYKLGEKSKKCKEDNDNPYHIDYKRQTKLFDDEKN